MGVEAELVPHHLLELGRAEVTLGAAEGAAAGDGHEVRVGDVDAGLEVLP